MDEIEEEHDPVAYITEIGLFEAVLVANVLHFSAVLKRHLMFE